MDNKESFTGKIGIAILKLLDGIRTDKFNDELHESTLEKLRSEWCRDDYDKK